MSSQPPVKRHRTNEDSEISNPDMIRSKYWFDDGNIVVEVENTQFRVHRSMLCRHSTVFKDMFDIPQPPKIDERAEVDGCPLVHLSDKASDFEYVMSIFYDNVRDYDMRVPMPFDHCAAILRLGKKYDIEHLFNDGLQRFQHEFPQTLSEWDALCDGNNETPGREIDLQAEGEISERGIALAHELSINSALPAACLSLVQNYDTSGILQKISILKNNPQDLDHTPLLMQCLAGREMILRQIHYKFQQWACLDLSSPIPDEKCTSIDSCTSSRALAVMLIASDSEQFFSCIEIIDSNVLPSIIDDYLCKECRQSLYTAIEGFRADLWNDLPSIFKIGESWEALKDF